jgi:5-methylcytosine-specific restriction endonuclease McrA
MKTKICTKCKRELDVSYFSKRKDRKNRFTSWCADCFKQYRKDNAAVIAKRDKQRRKNNIALRIKQQKQYLNNNVLFKAYYKQLEVFEEIQRCPKKQNLLEAKCAYCGRWIKPTNLQVKNRLQAFNGTNLGESRFYCSENCKQACPTYNQNKYPKGFKQATSREVVPLLRQLVLERDNWTCQRCEATTETVQLHVHHIIPYAQNKMQANDPDSCITLCKKCHKEVHSQEGCKYSDLKCKEI